MDPPVPRGDVRRNRQFAELNLDLTEDLIFPGSADELVWYSVVTKEWTPLGWGPLYELG